MLASASVCLLTAACAATTPGPAESPTTVHESSATVTLHGRPLELHLARPTPLRHPDVLVIYASGDGGWFGAAIDQWRQVARDGYAVAGFSARALLRIERPAGSALNPAQLAREYGAMSDTAIRTLGLAPAVPLLLTGWSRGAAFAILAAGEPAFAPRVRGVVALGLANGENLLVGEEDDDDDGAAASGTQTFPFETYGAIAQLPARCAVIESTHDNYLPAADAQRLFGADSSTRRFYAVEAKNHRFSGGKAGFAEALREALGWTSDGDAQ